MTSSMLRRQLKNLVQNYSEAEVKVREATSNDPWGPSSSQMADISDLTYNVVACNEIMTMLWKRLKDDKNWRHIHKSLTLLEYLLKTGDERVLLKMKDNVYIVKALTEYRFSDKDGKDQGVNVREKAKVVLVLMEDDEKLKEERDFAFKTREKTSKGAAAASSTDAVKDPSYKPVYVPGTAGLPSLDNIPSVADLAASFAARKEERQKQEAEKKEAERRAKMSEDELQWEDAGRGPGVKDDAWGGEKSEEETDAWGAPKQPKEAEGPWGTPDRPDSTDAEMAEGADAWGAPKNGEEPFEEGEDPFAAPEEVKFTEEDSEDPFQAPKVKSPEGKAKSFPVSEEDPFTSKKDDPFTAPKGDPFTAPKGDPFTAAKDDPFKTPAEDPFSAPKASLKSDPFDAPKDDPFSSKSDDPFGAPKDDPFIAPTENVLKTQAEDPFGAPKDDPFTATKSDPFDTPKDDPFSSKLDDPFGTPKDDPFTVVKEGPQSPPPKDDPFAAPSKPAEDPFGSPTSPKGDGFGATPSPPKGDPFSTAPADDPFAAPVTPPKKDAFSAPSKPSDDPFASPTSPPKDDPFAAPTTPPKDAASDPFSAPSAPSAWGELSSPPHAPAADAWGELSSPPHAPAADAWGELSSPPHAPAADAWGELSSPPHAPAADAWGAASPSQETKAADAWGDGAKSPVDDSDPFGDTTKPDNDPWGAPAAAPVNPDDAWGAPAPDTLASPSDPFGSTGDPWGAPNSTTSQGSGGGPWPKDLETINKTASFLGSAGASLVDLDDLFSCNPAPKGGGAAVASAVAAQTRAAGALNGPLASHLYQASAPPGGYFGSTLTSSYSASGQSFFQMDNGSDFGFNIGQSAPVQPRVLTLGPHSVFGAQTTQPGPLFGDLAGLTGFGQTPSMMQSGVSNQFFPNSTTNETNGNYNPFLL